MRVDDGAELGSAVHEYRHARDGPRAGGDAEPRCRRSGRCRIPTTIARCCALRCPRPSPPRASTRGDVIGIATDFTASTPLPVLADGTPLCELPELRDRPHAYVKLWKHHAAQPQADRINAVAAERGEPWLARYGGFDLERVGVRQGAAAARGGPGDLRAHGPLGRGGRLDRLAALRRVRPQRLHRRLQGHLAGRRLPVGRLRGGAEPRVRRLRASSSSTTRSAGSATAPAASPPRPRRGPGCRKGSRSPSATSTPTSPRRRREPSRPARCSPSWARPRAT